MSQWSRRSWLAATATACGGLLAGPVSRAAESKTGVPVTHPRATSGDSAIEPDWDERLTVTVGPREAQIVGQDDKALQAAVDYVARLGGGTVHILPGTYTLRNAVHLASHIRLLGSGEETRLVKQSSVRTRLAADSDWYDQEITLADARGFQIGDAICIQARNAHNESPVVLKRTLVARKGNRFKLDKPLRENAWQLGEATAATLFPIVTGNEVTDIAIENMVLDGNRENNELLDGNYAGCVFLQDCSRVRMRGLHALNYNGDGLSWQICHDVVVEECLTKGHSGLGLHPGSGSQRPVIRKNRVEDNHIGLFFCWGVKYGLAEQNVIRGTKTAGLSIGHRDTDNLIRDNEITGSGQVGVLFRPERGKGFAGDRNRLEKNRIIDNGGDEGYAIDVQGYTTAIVFANNEIRDTRGAGRRTAVRYGSHVGEITFAENHIEGFARALEDLRTA